MLETSVIISQQGIFVVTWLFVCSYFLNKTVLAILKMEKPNIGSTKEKKNLNLYSLIAAVSATFV